MRLPPEGKQTTSRYRSWSLPGGWCSGGHQSGETQTTYGCPPIRRNGRAGAGQTGQEPGAFGHCFQETPVQADTRQTRNQENMVNCRSEETAEQVAARRERVQQRTAGAGRRSEMTTVQSDARRARDKGRAVNRRAG